MTDEFRPVLSIRANVERPDASRFIRTALREIRIYIAEHDVVVQGPPFTIRHPASHHREDVEVGWPVVGAVGAGRIVSREMPPGLVRRTASAAPGSSPARSRDAVA